MRKWLHIAIAAVLAILAGTVAWQVLRGREPVYQGKPLKVWLRQWATTHLDGDSGDLGHQTETAIQQIGTNAIPIYLGMIATKESALRLKLLALLPNRWAVRLPTSNVYEYRLLGAYGLIALGAEAKLAVPALIALLKDANPDVRRTAAFTLQGLGRVASAALPSLIICLQDSSYTVQYHAILGVGQIRQKPERVIPLLITYLHKPLDPHWAKLRNCAICSLRQFGAQAKPAVPMLLRLLEDSHSSIRSDATNALKVIDPDPAVKAGVR
jgi:HEAT repeat protein